MLLAGGFAEQWLCKAEVVQRRACLDRAVNVMMCRVCNDAVTWPEIVPCIREVQLPGPAG